MAARTWIIPVRVSSLVLPGSETVMVWSRPVTTPGVTAGVPPRPRALPRATIWSPTATDDELPRGIVGRPETPVICSNATSSVGSTPMTVARYCGPVPLTWTEMLVAPLTTWLFVSTSPEEVRIMPVASPCPWPAMVTVMSTIAESTWAAMVAGSSAAPDPAPGDDCGGVLGRGASDGVAPEGVVGLAAGDLVSRDDTVGIDGNERIARVTPAPTTAPVTRRRSTSAAVRPPRWAGGGNTGGSEAPSAGGCPESPGSPGDSGPNCRVIWPLPTWAPRGSESSLAIMRRGPLTRR